MADFYPATTGLSPPFLWIIFAPALPHRATRRSGDPRKTIPRWSHMVSIRISRKKSSWYEPFRKSRADKRTVWDQPSH